MDQDYAQENVQFLETVEDNQGNLYECYFGIEDEKGEIITPKITSGEYFGFLKRIFTVPNLHLGGDKLKIMRYTAP